MEEIRGKEDILLLNTHYSDVFFKRRKQIALLMAGMIMVGTWGLIIFMMLIDPNRTGSFWSFFITISMLLGIGWVFGFGLGFIFLYMMMKKLKGCSVRFYEDRLVRKMSHRSEVHYFKDLTNIKIMKGPSGENINIRLKFKRKDVLFHGFDQMEDIEEIIKEFKPEGSCLKEKTWKHNYYLPHWYCIFFIGALALYIPFILWGQDKLQYAVMVVELGLIGYFLIKRPAKRSMNKYFGWVDFVPIGLWAFSLYLQIKSML